MRDFNEWISHFRESIANWTYYTDFPKVYENVNDVKIELNLLNSLIGSKDIKTDFINLVKKYPNVIGVIPILLAKREKEILVVEPNKEWHYRFDKNKTNFKPEDYAYFMEETGIFDLLSNHIIHSLVDYVTGIEVGMDTNGRKNRTGHVMEDLVESYIVAAGFIKNETYFKEMYKSDVESKFGLDLSKISNKGKTEKRFDYVLYKNGKVYAIECNFYSGGGSKLNETARSYEEIAKESKDIENFTFIWITDGVGWITARKNLEETFDCLETLYSLNDLNNGILKEIK